MTVKKTTKPTLKVEALAENAVLPVKAHLTDAGYDLYATQDILLWGNRPTLVHTGIAIKLPKDTVGDIRPRSGNSKRGIKVAYGTVDSGYTGEVLVNMSALFHKVKKGDKIAQLVVLPLVNPKIKVGSVMSLETDRGSKGFGSTDSK